MNNKSLKTTVTDELADELDTIAKRQQVSVAHILRQLIRKHVASDKANA